MKYTDIKENNIAQVMASFFAFLTGPMFGVGYHQTATVTIGAACYFMLRKISLQMKGL